MERLSRERTQILKSMERRDFLRSREDPLQIISISPPLILKFLSKILNPLSSKNLHANSSPLLPIFTVDINKY